jgi:peptidoglycan/LPS O-acetylase OafA/YrhL
VLDGNEIWQEKAYLPGMSAIAIGVLCAMAAHRWPVPQRIVARSVLAAGAAGLFTVLFFGPALWKAVGHANMLVLTISAAAVVWGCKFLCTSDRAPTGLNWLAGMGRLSYEIYLSHMFVVLATVAMFRAWAPDLRWGFLLYLPCIAMTVLLGAALEKWITLPCERKLRRGLAEGVPALAVAVGSRA